MKTTACLQISSELTGCSTSSCQNNLELEGEVRCKQLASSLYTRRAESGLEE